MKLYSYLDVLDVLGNNVNNFNIEISGVSSRSSEVSKGYVFVCIKGMHTTGNKYIAEAVKNGAVLLITEEIDASVVQSGIPYIKVPNARIALARLCARFYGNPEGQLCIKAVTGTNGKTSTVQILSEIYTQANIKNRRIGTLSGSLTTPDPEELFREFKYAFDNGYTHIVMEASSHALALEKLHGIDFDGAIFTNLTPDHLDFHSCMADYALSKSKLFCQSKYGLYNADDEYGTILCEKGKGKKYYYSARDKKADFFADNIKYKGNSGIEYDLVYEGGIIHIESGLVGIFNVYNTLSAISMALVDGIEPEIITDAVKSISGVSGRLEKLDLGSIDFSVYIDYAHTPDALEKLLETVRGFRNKGQKITLLFGCGGDRDKSKRSLMGKIASSLADFVIITSDNVRTEEPSCIISDIMKGIDKERPHIVIEDRKTAIEYAVNNAVKDEIILLAGKGHENYEIVGKEKYDFNEKEITAKAVRERFKKYDH